MDDSEESQTQETKGDAKLLEEIRDRYKYASNAWMEIREEAKKDRRYLSGDPWDAGDRKARADAGRPCINHDELNQYVNQAINQVRQSPPAIKIEPAGTGSSEKTSELHQGIVRGIEYQSDAQSCYMVAFENALSASYGFFRVTREYEHDESFNQHIRVKAILNADSVLYDPDCKEPDWSDANFCFVLETIQTKEFGRKYPGAQKTSFTEEDARLAPDWVKGEQILVAEYWKVEVERSKLYQLPDGTTTTNPPENQGKLRSRTVEKRVIVQYVTNGVEILETSEQPGTIIPVIPVIGKEMYVDDGSGPERRLFSLVRMARDPQMSLAYLNSLEMEEAGLTPKVPYIGAVGQFETDKQTWEEVTKVPHAYAQYDVVTDESNSPLPPPQRQTFTPNFQAYEVAKDSCRRAIMSSMGIMPLPTAAQRTNEKSGIALKQIQQQQSVGSFHFTANLHRALRMAGRIIEQWLPVVYDTERQVAIAHDDGKREILNINQSQQPQPAEQNQIGDEQHEVTISVGPSYESQREEASEFLDTLMSNLKTLPLAPPQSQKLLSLAIKGKQLGPLGDQMAEIISPPDQNEMPPQAQQAISKAQQETQAINAYAKKLEGEVQQMKMEKEARVIEQTFQLKKAEMDNQTKIAIAEISTKAQIAQTRVQMEQDAVEMIHEASHDRAMSAQEHAQTMDQQQNAAENAQVQQQQAAEQAAQQPQQGE